MYPLHTGANARDGLEFLFLKGEQKGIKLCTSASFLIHSPFELPNAFDTSEYCNFDYEKIITVSIFPEVVFTDESLKSIDPKTRNCYFDGEKNLKFFKIYSKNNCEMECLAEYAMEKCNCTPYHLIRGEETPLCYLGDVKCIVNSPGMPKSLRYCGCLERCNSIKYRFEIYSDRLAVDDNSKYLFLIS